MGRTSCSWALGLGWSVCHAALSLRISSVWGCRQTGDRGQGTGKDRDFQVSVSLKASHLDRRLETQQLDRCVPAEEASFHAHSCTAQYSWPFKEDVSMSSPLNLKGWFFQKQQLQHYPEVGGANRRLLEERKPVCSQISYHLV